jgi:DNA-binding CsgD family transcriptional regulator/tetratricopeptide (TPR) repeat protein
VGFGVSGAAPVGDPVVELSEAGERVVGMVGRVASPRFVDRRKEMLAIEAALARTRGGRGSLVFVGGEAGIGKSRLISEVAGRAEREAMAVVVGECLPLCDGELPYAPVVGALRSLIAQREGPELEAMLGSVREELTVLLPELASDRGGVPSSPVGQGSQARLFEQLLTLLASAASARPLVLVVEDFQWADRSTCDFFSFFIRAARRLPIALIITYRSDELRRGHPLRHCMLELERTGQAIRVELGPFTRTEVRDQVAAILDETPPVELVDRLFERSEGNPFFTEELLASSFESGESLPESLRDTLLARVEARSAVVRDVLRIAAVAGRTVDHGLLAAVADLSEDDLNGALREAVESYLLAPDSATVGYSFRHALLREAIYSDLLPGERRDLHLRLAQILSGQPALAGAKAAGAAELAHHWYAARELPAALAALVSAGVAAEGLCAPAEAWEHYERALDIWDRVAPVPGELPLERVEVLRRAAEAALMTGEEERAISLANDVLARVDEHHDPIGAALAYERLGRYLWIAGRDEEALLAYRRAVELMPDDPPSEERALVLAAEGQALMLCDRTTESNSRCAQALAIARSVGAEAVEAHVLNTMCGNLSAIGQFDQAVQAASQARAIAGRLRLADEIHRSYTNGGGALYQAGRVEESIAIAREGIASAGEFGVERHWGDFLRGELAGRLVQLGRWREAERLLEEVIDRSPTGVHAGMAYRCLGYLQVGLGEFDAAARALDRAEQHTRRSLGSMTLAPPAVARASLELWAGRPQAAAAVVSDCLQRVGDGEHVFFTARLYELGARACADLAARAPGDDLTKKRETVTAERLLERLDGLIARITGAVPPVVLASRAACAGEYSRIGGGDAALWADARRHRETCTNPYQAAYARWREAEALLASGGDRPEVEALVRDAHAVADELGAQPLRVELETLARRARIELAHDGPSEPAPNAAVERLELTPREIDVLGLLAGGLTNREIGTELFISDKTASVHVSRILTKLSVPNRAAAAAAAHHLGLTPARAASAV